MKAAYIEEFGNIDSIKVGERPTPSPEAGQVQIHIKYSSVNPVEWKICEGYLENILTHQFPLVLGWDASGVVSAVGEGVTKFREGDEVYAFCRAPIVQWGTFAEYVCFDAADVAFKPATINFAQAATIPLVGLTAWQAFHDFAKVEEGQSVLIHGGAGGVGSVAIPLAKHAGLKVYTTASARNHEYVTKLGADLAIDYTTEDFVERMKELEPGGVDMVFDCVGGRAHRDSYPLVKRGGSLATIVEPVDRERAAELGIRVASVFVRPNGDQLATLAALIDDHILPVPEIQERPLEEVVEALKFNKQGHTRGKVALRIS